MTIRQLINVLIDAPDKDKQVTAVFKPIEINNMFMKCQWNTAQITSALATAGEAVLEIHPFDED